MAAPIEERVAYLEGKVEEHSRGFGEIRELLVHTDGHVQGVDRKVDRFRTELASHMDGVDQKVDRFRDELSARIDALDQKVDRFRDELAGRIDRLDQRLTSRIDTMDHKLSRHFTWLVAMQFALLLTLVGALIRG